MPITVREMERRLAGHSPRRHRLRPLLKRAAVALILSDVDGQARLLMIRRAARSGDPWSGQMAFPGGLMEPENHHGFDVACRETMEEIGLALEESGRCIGRLSELMTHLQWRRRAMVISPYVFRVDGAVTCVPNQEVSEVVWVPLSYLANRVHRERMDWSLGPLVIPLPCYRYQGRLIWGLSLNMLDELLELLEQ